VIFADDQSLHDAALIDLLARSRVDAELQRRFNTKNIVGIYGEHLVAHALGGVLEPNSNYGFDVTLGDGRTVQVKTRMLTSATVQTGERSAGDCKADATGNWPFDLAACVLPDHATWAPVLAFTLPANVLPRSGRGGQMRPPWSNRPEAVDLLPLIDGDAVHAAIAAAVSAAPGGVAPRTAPRARSTRRKVRFVVNGRPQPPGRETLGWVAQHPARMPVDELRALVRARTGVADPDREPWRITLPSGDVIEAVPLTDD
jgi:hypothetical protein